MFTAKPMLKQLMIIADEDDEAKQKLESRYDSPIGHNSAAQKREKSYSPNYRNLAFEKVLEHRRIYSSSVAWTGARPRKYENA